MRPGREISARRIGADLRNTTDAMRVAADSEGRRRLQNRSKQSSGGEMSGNAQNVLKAIQDAVAEIEALAKEAAGMTGERAEAVRESVRERLADVTARARELERDLLRGARAAEGYVRENPWRSIGIAAAAAFLLGALMSRRD
jgi:ElaB/YqjD/DUF883 family membrane-anchored ribosome-binding protein